VFTGERVCAYWALTGCPVQSRETCSPIRRGWACPQPPGPVEGPSDVKTPCQQVRELALQSLVHVTADNWRPEASPRLGERAVAGVRVSRESMWKLLGSESTTSYCHTCTRSSLIGSCVVCWIFHHLRATSRFLALGKAESSDRPQWIVSVLAKRTWIAAQSRTGRPRAP
jgi:hypothetical protein